MNHFEFSWQTLDGLKLFGQGWQPETEVRGVICLVHGLGDHSGRFTGLAKALTETGYVLIGFDLRGHGKSQGRRGHTPSYEYLMNDITHLLKKAEDRYPDPPIFLYGISMGGNLVLNYAIRHQPQLAGVIATSSWLRMATEPPAWKEAMARFLNKLWPAMSTSSGEDPETMSKDPDVVRAYIDDPLVHDRVTPRMYVEIRQAAQWALDHAAQFPLPLLIMHGSADRTMSPEGSREFKENAPSNCTYRIWEGLFHDINNEPEQQDVFEFLIAWLERQTPN
jgi:alpha-beta hydrolase superfamily lysophospholipase